MVETFSLDINQRNVPPERIKPLQEAFIQGWGGLPVVGTKEQVVDTLSTLRKDGKIGDTVAMAAVGDQFGIEQSTAAREGLTKAGFKLVYDKSYPFGSQDLQPIVNDAQAGNPDTFVALS